MSHIEMTREEALIEGAAYMAEIQIYERELTEGIFDAIQRVASKGNPFHFKNSGKFAPSPDLDKKLHQASRGYANLERKEGPIADAALAVINRFMPRTAAWLRNTRQSADLINNRVVPIYQTWRKYKQVPQRKRLWALVMAVGPDAFESILDKHLKQKGQKGQAARQAERRDAPTQQPATTRVRFDPSTQKVVRRRLPGDQK